MSNEQKMICTVGIPGCGKTTWADEYIKENTSTVKLERDIIRAENHTSTGNLWDYKFSKGKENAVTTVQKDLIRIALGEGKSVIVSDTNLNTATRYMLKELAADFGIEAEFKEFDVPLHQAMQWNRKRPEHVPESVLINMERKMRVYLDKFIQTPESREITSRFLNTCVIMDIDGTLADMRGIRGPFDWEKVHLDKPIQFIVDYAKFIMDNTDHSLILFSGRDSSCRKLTEEWLWKQGITFSGLYMRPSGSNANDSLIKETLFDNHVKGKYSVDHVVDDRAQVCKMWESMGFRVMNVGGFLADF